MSLLAFSLISVKSFAAGKDGADKGEKKTTSINFEDELVEGQVKKPELFYLLQKKQFNYKRLIKLRDNFLPEMKRDSEELR
jgi:hypothetical protein